MSHLRRDSHASLLTNLSPPSPRLTVHQVATAEPPAYWCGRISALLDRYRNEDLATSVSQSHKRTNSNSFGTPKSETDKLHTPAANTARMRKALEYLHSQCVTSEAQESFLIFQLQFAAMQNNPELSRPIKCERLADKHAEKERAHMRKRSEPMSGGKSAGVRPFRRSVGKASAIDGSSDFGEGEESVGRSSVRKISLLDRMLGRKEKRESLS
jgi:hypothetical protein